MLYEGVCFFEDACKDMSEEQFIAHHKDVFWQDRDEKTRLKMLADVYKRMTGGKKPAKAEKAKK